MARAVRHTAGRGGGGALWGVVLPQRPARRPCLPARLPAHSRSAASTGGCVPLRQPAVLSR